MDLYVCGNSPLLRPPACPRWYMDKKNGCRHVPSGEVDAGEPGNKACRLMATSPKLVLSDQEETSLRATAAENLLLIRRKPGLQMIHCRDGFDRTVEESTISELPKHVKDEEVQDIWVDVNYSVEDEDDLFGDDLFGDDYPRGPVVDLGLLSREGAIYRIKQEPFTIVELTAPTSRTPFLHAIMRQECNNGKQDVWPTVVFPQQPSILYRMPTVTDLLSWLQGKSVDFRCIRLPSPVARLCTSRGRADHCVALTEYAKVYHWRRDGLAGMHHSMTLREALSTSFPTSVTSEHPVNGLGVNPVGCMDISSEKIAVGLTVGAAITLDGVLYAFSLTKPSSEHRDILTPHLTDLDDGTPEHRISQPFVPQRASLNDSLDAEGKSPTFVDVAAGDDHLVALTAEGKVFTVGSGFQGALGIGDKQFELDNAYPKAYDWSYESVEFSEDWQEAVVPQTAGRQKKVVQVAAGYQSTLLAMRAVSES